jgi:hypothetical protein
MMQFTAMRRVVCVLPLVASLSACGAFPSVQPWEKGVLSKPEMTMDGDTLEAKFSEHILSSREGASGGTGTGGGGCGCY